MLAFITKLNNFDYMCSRAQMAVRRTTVRRKKLYTDLDLRSLPLPDRGLPAHTSRAVAREKDIHDQGNPAYISYAY